MRVFLASGASGQFVSVRVKLEKSRKHYSMYSESIKNRPVDGLANDITWTSLCTSLLGTYIRVLQRTFEWILRPITLTYWS